jgi:aryl-alcohol dehydrogenase-like predicted oxidoreductase
MLYRNLAGTELKASAIGFGCGGILGSVGAGRSWRAMETAFDQGINYFDVARSYGFGAAESLVGKFIQGKRDQIVLASKFGIVPPRRRAIIDRLRPIIRPVFKTLRRLAPSAHQAMRARAGAMSAPNQFSVEIARTSLEESLRELKTDHLDVWLLHGCSSDVAENDELFAFLDECVRQGKVRYYGAASYFSDVAGVISRRTGASLAQFENNPAEDYVRRFENPRGVAVNTHSPFGRGVFREKLTRFLTADPDSAKKWSGELNLDLLTAQGIDEFLLQFSLAANRTGVVICGMSRPEHIRGNARVAGVEPPMNVEKVAAEMREKRAFGV